MRTYPWRSFSVVSLGAAIVLAVIYASVGFDDGSYHPALTAIEFLDPSPTERRLNAAKYGTIAFFSTLVGTFLLLCLLRWTWYFLLARLAEISQAIKTNP